MTDVEKYLGNIAKKSGEDIEKLRAEYQTILDDIPPGANREEKALRELNKKYVADRSSAVMRQFIVVGIGDVMDYTKKRRDSALEAYQKDKDDALQRGLVQVVDGSIVAIDQKEFFDKDGKMKNKNFGKPLLPQHARTCLALVKNEEDGGYVMANLNLRGKKATGDLPPMNVEIKARLNGDATKGYSTSEKATNYETINVISTSDLLEKLGEYAGDHIKVLGDCFDYHQSIPEGTPEFYNRYVITPGQVMFYKEADEGKTSGFLVLDDISVDKQVSCFVPQICVTEEPSIGQEINVIARTSIGKAWDSEKKKNTDEDVLQLNIMGIIPS